MANGLLKQLGLKQRKAAAVTPAGDGAAPASAGDAGDAGQATGVPLAIFKPKLTPMLDPLDPSVLRIGAEMEKKDRAAAEEQLKKINQALAQAQAYLDGLDASDLSQSSYAALMADVRKRFPEAADAAAWVKRAGARWSDLKSKAPSPQALFNLVDATARRTGAQVTWSMGNGKNLATLQSDKLLAAYMAELPAGVSVRIAGGVVQLSMEGAALSVPVPAGQADATANKDGAKIDLKLNDFTIEVANEGWKEFDPQLRARWQKVAEASRLVADLKASRDEIELQVEQKQRDGQQVEASLTADLAKRQAAFDLAWTKLQERVNATATASEEKITAAVTYLKKDKNDKDALKAGLEAEVDLKELQGQLKAWYATPTLEAVLKVAAAADKVSAKLELKAVKTGVVVSAAFEKSLDETRAAIELLARDGKTQAVAELKKKADDLSAKLKLLHETKDLKVAAELEKTLKEVRAQVSVEAKVGAASVKVGGSGSSGGEVGGQVQIDVALRDGRSFVGQGDKLSFTANVSNKGYKFEVSFSMGEPIETESLQDLFASADQQIKALYKLAGDQEIRDIKDVVELNRRLQDVMGAVKKAAEKARSVKKSDFSAKFGFSVQGEWPAGGKAMPPAAMFSATINF